MKCFEFKSKNTEEIKNLFTRTFSNSEGEGKLIGNLAESLITNTNKEDICICY